jgi:hypothetical protein
MASCQNEKKQNNLENKKILNNELNLEGHTFFKVTETDSGKVLLQPCSASIENYKFYRDSLYHNWGQEFDILKKTFIKQNESIYILKGFNQNTNTNDEIQIEKIRNDNSYLKINNEIFIDSIHLKTVRLIKDCPNNQEINDSISEKKDITFNTINHVKGIEFSLDCNSKDYVYFLVGGQFITSKLSMNSKLEKINDNEFNIYFAKPLINPINKDFEDSIYFSEVIPIAKANHINDKLEFTWFGFYNTKTGKRIHLENPFTNKVEKESIILIKCNN